MWLHGRSYRLTEKVQCDAVREDERKESNEIEYTYPLRRDLAFLHHAHPVDFIVKCTDRRLRAYRALCYYSVLRICVHIPSIRVLVVWYMFALAGPSVVCLCLYLTITLLLMLMAAELSVHLLIVVPRS